MRRGSRHRVHTVAEGPAARDGVGLQRHRSRPARCGSHCAARSDAAGPVAVCHAIIPLRCPHLKERRDRRRLRRGDRRRRARTQNQNSMAILEVRGRGAARRRRTRTDRAGGRIRAVDRSDIPAEPGNVQPRIWPLGVEVGVNILRRRECIRLIRLRSACAGDRPDLRPRFILVVQPLVHSLCVQIHRAAARRPRRGSLVREV